MTTRFLFRPAAILAAGGLWLAAVGGSVAFAGESLGAPGLPRVEVLGCRLQGLGVVCDRGGKLLPNREKKLRKKEPAKAPASAPAEIKSKSSSGSTKSQGAKSKSEKSQSAKPAVVPAEEEIEEPAARSEKRTPPETSTESEDAKAGPVAHSCPPGNVVLEKPDASGSYCEPVATGTPKAAETPPVTEEPAGPQAGAGEPQALPAAETKTETLIAPPSGGITTPSPSSVERKTTTPPQMATPAVPAGPQDAAPLSGATPAEKRICCKSEAFGKVNGRPYSPNGMSMCGVTELDAKNLLKSFADAANYRLSGPVTCESK